MTPALEITRLSKRFGGLPATRDVSLTVMPGERRLIIGPNGAGKTTLFNLITGDLTPDAGSVKLFGRELLRIPTQQRVHSCFTPGTRPNGMNRMTITKIAPSSVFHRST